MQQPQPPTATTISFGVPSNQQSARQQAAHLLEAVLDETVEPRLAINRWPEIQGQPDASLDCAYQILWHFESDEAQQKTEMFYLDTQLELLRQVASALKAGQDLPAHILYAYLKQPPVRFYYPRPFWSAARRYWRTLIQEGLSIISSAWALLPQK